MFASSSINLCAFCYKSTTLPQNQNYKNQRDKCSVEFFCTVLGRFVKNEESEKDREFIGLLDGCRDCDNLIGEFCKLYHKIKLLDLQLLLKLENLGNVMKLADRVPSRLKILRQSFEKLAEENSPQNQVRSQVCQDGLKKLKSFRTATINKCFRGRTMEGLQPRVLLERIDDVNESSKPLLGDSKSTDSLNVISADINILHGWLMSFVAVVFLILSYSFEDHYGSHNDNESITDLTNTDVDNYDIQDSMNINTKPKLCSMLIDNDDAVEGHCLPVGEDKLDSLPNIEEGIENEMPVETKHSPTFDITTIPIHNLAKPAKIRNGKEKKLRQSKKLRSSSQQFWFHCSLCKTSYSTNGALRKHKNNTFHRFLKQKTLKIFVNRVRNVQKGYPTKDKINTPANGVENTLLIKQEVNVKHYNLRETKVKSYLASNNDDRQSDTDSSNGESELDLSSNNISSTSTSETSDTDDYDNNADLEPKIVKNQKRTICPETNCHRSFLTTKGLQTHVDLHGNFPCQFCDISLTYAPDLPYHENEMHINIKQEELQPNSQQKLKFKCSRCPQNFRHKITLMHHFVNTHLGLSTTFSVCSICQYASRTESLGNHNLIFHSTTGIESAKIPRCNKCPAYFRLTSQLFRHKQTIHNETLSCNICENNFKWPSALVRHLKFTHPDSHDDNLPRPQFKCLTCGMVCTSTGGLSRHVLKTHSKKNIKNQNRVSRKTKNASKKGHYTRHQLNLTKVTKFICSICALEVASGAELANHEANHQKNSEKYVTCPRCNKYIPRVKYTGHFMISHLGANQKHKKFKCQICESQVVQLNQHYKNFHKTNDVSTKIYKCEENNCKAYFIKAIQLIFHKKKTHNYNRIDCKYCGKTLKGKNGLSQHMSSLHPEKCEDPSLPIACDRDNCKKRFETEAELEWHQKWDTHDSGSHEKKCKKCGKEFASKGLLNRHIIDKCADPKIFICQICGKGFKTKTYLETHLRFHKGPDGYEWQCQTCGKKFMNKYMLEDHMTSHTKEKSFICQWCGEIYGYKRSWKKHVLTKHKDKEGLPEVKKRDTRNRMSRKGAKRGECVLAGVKPL